MATTSYCQAESDFYFSVSNLLLEKCKGQTETNFPASYHQMRIAIRSKKQFTTDDIKYIFECLNDEFERFALSRLKWISKPKIESSRILQIFLLVLLLFIVRTIIMSLGTVGKLCPEFRIFSQESNYSLNECLKHSFNLVQVCLNYESNVDIVVERIVFERLVFKDYKLQNYKWFLEPEYVPRKETVGIKYIDFENVVEFVLMQQRDPLIHYESLDN